MREYETLYLLTPDSVPQKTEDLGNKLTNAVKNHSGQVLTLFNWGKRRTAYPVGKHSNGIFIYFNYLSADGGIVNEIERILKNEDTVLKFITVKLDDHVKVEERIKEKRLPTLSSIDEETQQERVPEEARAH